ncbi:MAG TPA: type I restriction endonuclease subunit R [Miltoncostaeaceae bacterium]|nr:type I restriction endonuclease subunit R [Miltoncostaeaceae bacterium]
MSPLPFGEDSLAEQPALALLEELGWRRVAGPDISPGGITPGRNDWRDVVLADRLHEAVERLNPELPREAVRRVVELALTTSSPNVVDDHAAFHRLLLDGVPVTWVDRDGGERTVRARLVDFRDVGRNECWAVNQFTIVQGAKNRRPDVLLFVNGLPLAEIELKNPADGAATPQSAVNQLADYRDSIPGLYRYVEIVAVSDVWHALAGTISTPPEHFARWRSMDPADDAGRDELDVMVRGMFAPARLLDLVENFCLFQTDGRRTWKVLAKYHQVDAVNRAVEATRAALGGSGRAGVVWHTQGSGKSLSMVFYAQKLRRDPAFANPTIVAVTDRNDLDQQLHETFRAQPTLAQAVRRAESIDGGPDSLRALLNVPAGGIVFTTIQKFATKPGEDMPVLSERTNIIVMADEAHRSHYGGATGHRSFAENITQALPNATRIGFTGTPIERGDRSTRITFGDYISVYSITRAVEDGATVPIYYEARRIPIEVSDSDLLERVDDVLADEEEAARSKLSAWARLEEVVGQPERIERVGADVAEHFTLRTQELPGKALVVGMSRRICARLAGRLKELLGDEAVTCVMSASATDTSEIRGPGGEYRRSQEEERRVAQNFKDPAHPLRVVVVRDMWLTGFDVPVLHTLYIDKPMRDHGLLQAIARVNRVFGDKPGGLVVDYIGIGEDLRASLSAYDPSVADEATIPLETAIAHLREKHEVVSAMLHGVDYSRWRAMESKDHLSLLHAAVETVLADDDTAKRFLTEAGLFARWYKLVRPHEPAISMADDAQFFAAIAGAARKLSTSGDAADPQAEQAIKQFLSEGLAAGEVVDVFALMGEDRPELSVLSDEFLDALTAHTDTPHLGIAALRRLLDGEIRVQARQNQLQAKLFSERMGEVLARYNLRQVSTAEIIRELVELAKRMRAARRRNEKLGLSREELAFYDALAGGAETSTGDVDPQIAAIAKALVKGIRQDLTVDWTSRASAEAAVRRKIKRLLRQQGYKPTAPPPKATGSGGGMPSTEDIVNLILRQARVLYAAWPEV